MTPEQIEIIEQHIRNRREFAKSTDPDVAKEMEIITDAIAAMLIQCEALESIQDELYCSKCGDEYMKVCVRCEAGSYSKENLVG